MRIVSLFTVYNEQRFMRRVLEHQIEQGVAAYVIDNESTDDTLAIVKSFLGRGVIGYETLPRRGVFELATLLRRLEQLHQELGADWYLHHDADQFRYAPGPYRTLAEGIAAVDAAGYNAINFDVFDFMPTHRDEDYEGTDFVSAMKYYYYFKPRPLNQLKLWKNFGQTIELAPTGGHTVNFAGRHIYPQPFIQRHYYVLSLRHAIEKYCEKRFSPAELAQGWHGRRATVQPDELCFPERSLLKHISDDNTWDTSDPWAERYLFKAQPTVSQPLRARPVTHD